MNVLSLKDSHVLHLTQESDVEVEIPFNVKTERHVRSRLMKRRINLGKILLVEMIFNHAKPII